jgi:hypothetical protein
VPETAVQRKWLRRNVGQLSGLAGSLRLHLTAAAETRCYFERMVNGRRR